VISQKKLEQQLKKLHFNPKGWGRSEARELCSILMEDEEVEQLVNGYYEAGFALLVATKNRVLLVDKKPLNYLTVEDMRFDMISEFDYSHRLIGAHVTINSNSKTFSFTSLNQPRLRSLIMYVQNRMTEMKKVIHEQQETQQFHLEQMNEQLQRYLETARQQTQLQKLQAEHTQQIADAATRQADVATPDNTPAPIPTLVSQSSFERAAAVSMGLSEPVYYQVSDAPLAPPEPAVAPADSSSLQKIILTPQQIGLAAARRVIPVISAYGRVPLIRQRQRFVDTSQVAPAESA
jgi:hypothetical protein